MVLEHGILQLFKSCILRCIPCSFISVWSFVVNHLISFSFISVFHFFFLQYKKSPLQTIGEEQTQNPYTELLVLKAHHDIVRFLVRLDEYR